MKLGGDNEALLPIPKRLPFGTKRSEYDARRSQLVQARSSWLEEAKDISDYIQLRRGRYLAGKESKRRRSSKVLNEKATFASRICGAGMLAGVSSPSRPWLKIGTPDKELNKFGAVKQWIDTVEMYMYQVFSSSNYYHVKQASYRDMADFGQGPVLIDEDYDNAINCYCSPAGEYLMSVNDKGVVDTLYREMTKTTLEIMQLFYNRGNVPHEVLNSYNKGNYNDTWTLVGLDQPNIYHIGGERGALGAKFMKVYYCLDVADKDGNAVLQTTGTFENPISAPRWDVQVGDTYGDGCGALVLPTTKSLQVLERRKGQMVDKMAVPPLQAPESKSGDLKVNHGVGQVSYYPSQQISGAGGNPISPLYTIEGQQLQAVMAEMQILEGRIDTGYFVPLFQATLNSDRREVTAREIEERHEEKLVQLGPVLERTHYEGLNHDVRRTFGILSRNGVLPPPPPEMDGMELDVEYISILAVAQRAAGAGPIERLAGFIGNLAAGNPEVLDKLDMDKAVDEYADILGSPNVIIRPEDKVQEIREKRAQDIQNQQQAAMVSQGAQDAETLSKADTGRDSNLLADILGGSGRLM